ncbi:cbb3-type cytochrome c oxidase subunit I [uncultured Arcobacter sp.]|uniref:cytochrome c oxidase subunit I n=1 Tax=uncultured Arcobacter sp. TaxID=165434 RepID=UPI002602F2DD|nr:cbb3-type cytochrome c oxidase subunit I [uncultured Arcobacter sp.]
MMNNLTQKSFYDETHTVFGHHDNKILQWIFSIDHKRIAILYLAVMMAFFVTAIFIALSMRMELFSPGQQIMDPNTYNQAFTLHGTIMIFLFVVPGIPAVFGNFLLPLLIGARDVSFPRLNLLSWWLYLLGAILAVTSLFVGQGFADTGWTFYAPYSVKTGTNVIFALSAAYILGLASILTGINFVVTIHRLRAPGMNFFKMPLFVWGLYSTAWIQILATPVIGITLILVILERTLGIGIFDPSKGGDPILYEHLFWIYSHPAVYLMILPAFGVVSEILPTFCRRTIFGYRSIAVSSAMIAIIGYLVWGHHLFTSGMSEWTKIIFSFLTFFVAIPTGIKFFDWVATMYKASIIFSTPMLWVIGTIITFAIGGLTGITLVTLGVDIHLHDTYYVVAHFHYTIFGGVVFMLFAAMHYWFPKFTGKMYDETKAKIAFVGIFIGFNTLWFPMFLAGALGMPRRYFDYLPEFTIYHRVAGVGAVITVASILFMLYVLYKGIKNGKPAGNNPWNSTTLEWQISSPPPLENFKHIPYIDFGPYEYENGKPKRDLSKIIQGEGNE